jgi:hypothetical protein
MKRWHVVVMAILILTALFLADGGAVYLKEFLSTFQPGATSTQSTTSTRSLNEPPKAAFMYRTPTRTLKYIAPTDQDLIMFLNNSTDPDLPFEALESRWYVQYNGTGDWQPLNASRDYSTTLPAGQHMIKLVVSDGHSQDSMIQSIVVDRSDVYPSRQFTIGLKGINYHIGRRYMGEYGRYPDADEINESLDVIRYELGCNAIKLFGDSPDLMVFASQKAIEKGFQIVILSLRHKYAESPSPHREVTIDEHVKAVIEFSKSAEELHRKYGGIVLCIGEELQYTVTGLVDAPSYDERIDLYWKLSEEKRTVVNAKLNEYLATMVKGVRENFLGPVTYSPNEGTRFAVKWRELDLDIVAPMAYYEAAQWTETEAVKDLLKFKTYGKPVYVTEFGVQCCVGAMANASGDPCTYQKSPIYSQDEQVHFIDGMVRIFTKARVDGIFYWMFIYKHENDAESYGLVKWNGEAPATRKLGFYMYKSYALNQSQEHPSGETLPFLSASHAFALWQRNCVMGFTAGVSVNLRVSPRESNPSF